MNIEPGIKINFNFVQIVFTTDPKKIFTDKLMLNLLTFTKDKFAIKLFIILFAWCVITAQYSIINADDLRGFPSSIVFRETEGNNSAATTIHIPVYNKRNGNELDRFKECILDYP